MVTKRENSAFCAFVVIFTQSIMALIMGINATALNPVESVIADFVNATYHIRYFEYLPSDKIIVVLAQSALVWGSFLGAFLVRMVTDRLSRKGGVALSHLLNLSSTILMSPVAMFCNSYEALIAGRFLNGVSRGIGFSVVAVLVAETTTRHRLASYQGPYTYMLYVGAAIGVGLGHSRVFGNADMWPCITAASAPLSVVYLAAYFWLPQTPGYFIAGGDNTNGLNTLKKLRKGNQYELEMEIETIKKEIISDTEIERASIFAIFTIAHYRRQMIAGVLVQNCTQLTGMQAIFFYSNMLFVEAGIPREYVTFASVGLFAQCIIAGAIAIVLVRRIGTRKMFLIGTFIIGLGLSVFTIATALKETAPQMPVVALVAAIFFVFGSFLGIQITIFALPSELTTQTTRPTVILIGSVIYWINAGLIGTIMPYSLSAWGAYAYTPFIFFAIFEFIYAFTCVPETHRKTVEEIQRQFGKPDLVGNDVGCFDNQSYDTGRL